MNKVNIGLSRDDIQDLKCSHFIGMAGMSKMDQCSLC